MIKGIKLLVLVDNGNMVEVELEPHRLEAVVKLLGLDFDGSNVTVAEEIKCR